MGEKLIIAIQGERGSYSEQAASQLLGPEIEVFCCEYFEEVFQRSTSLNDFILDLVRKKSGYVVLSVSHDFNVDESIETQEDSVERSVLRNDFGLSEQFPLEPLSEKLSLEQLE